MNTVESALVLIVVFVPGFVASAVSREIEIDSPRRSAIEAIAYLLHQALYVHLMALGIFLLLDALLPIQLVDILENGLGDYAQDDPQRAMLVFGGFLILSVMILAPISGSLNLPSRLPMLIIAGLRKIKIFPGYTPPNSAPVWYKVFLSSPANQPERVWVRVKMNRGDIYTGTLIQYPVAPDTAPSKDFLIENVSYYPEGDPDRLQIMNAEAVDGFGGVLLNTKDVEAIAVVYYDEGEV